MSKLITRRRSIAMAAASIAVPAIIKPAEAQFFNPTMFFPGNAVFNPTSLVGTQGGFWRADVGVTGTTTVTAWADQGAHGNNLSVLASPVAQSSPSWSATGFNTSFPGLNMHANPVSSGLGINSPVINSTTLSWFILLTDAGSAASLRYMWDYVNAAGNDFTTPSVAMAPNGSNTAYTYSSGIQGDGGSAFSYTANVPQVFGCIFDGVHSNAYLNFSVVGSASTFSSTLGTSGTGAFGVGIGPNGNVSNFVVAWVLVTNTVLTGGNLTSFKTWTNSNWGTSF